MIRHSLRTKVLALVGGGLLLATVGMSYLAHIGMTRMIDRDQTTLYQNALDHLLLTLAQYDAELQNTLQVDAYRDQFQEEALRIIRQNNPKDQENNVYPFILDHRGQVLLHPTLPHGDKSLSELDFIQTTLNTSAGNFKYRHLGEDKWLIYAHFEPWNWMVAYSLKQTYLYRDLASFHQNLLPVLMVLLLTITAVLLYGLQRFLQPVLQLTESASTIAAGDFGQPIVVSGQDEVASLGRTFETMRTAVLKTITSLDQQRKELENEVQERQRAEHHALESEERLRVIISSVADTLLVTDLNHRVTMFNPAAQASFPQMAIGKKLHEIVDDIALEEALEPIILGRQKQSQREWSRQPEGASPQVYSVNAAAIHDPDNKLMGVVTLFHDVTQAKELDRLKSEFLSTAAHELGTPLAVIQGYAELLETNPDAGLPDRQTYLGIILQRCQDLETLIEDLLDVSRIEAGQVLNLALEELDLGILVEQLVTSYQNGETTHRFMVQPPKSPLVVSADRSKIRRVLENILSNAVKFSPPGSPVEIAFAIGGNRAWCLVKDRGIGIPLDKQKRIFEKFYRIDGSNTAPSGLGLGLHIVNSIVAAHDGQIKVQSHLGQGTTFAFGLPMLPQTPRSANLTNS